MPVPAPDLSTPLERGIYLTSIADCSGCHTAWTGNPNPGLYAGGNGVERAGGVAYSANLTSDPSALGGWTPEIFRARMRSGRALVEPGKPLFTLADRSTMWAMLSVPEAALAQVREGQTVHLQLDSLPSQTVSGKLTWIAAKVEDRTRMASARVEVPNPQGTLRANMFARARIITRGPSGALVVPASAVQRVEGQAVVFVKLAEDLFEARVVRLGARFSGKLEVAEGLDPQEQLALADVFPLKSQLLISRLGAGCADE